MAKLYNLARMTTATTGTGTITLGSAVSSYLSFASAGVQDGDTVTYAIVDGSNREVGRGVYTSAGTTLTRTVLTSTNSNTAISLSGSAEVFITAAGQDITSDVQITGGSISGITDLAVADGGTGSSSFTAYSVLAGGTTSTGPVQNISGVGTSGQVLMSNGAGALPTWQTGGGMTLLGTITTTSGSSQSLSGLTLTGYKQVVLVWQGVNAAGTATNYLVGQSTSDDVIVGGPSDSDSRGVTVIDLNAGTFWGGVEDALANASASATFYVGDLPITTASTAISVSGSSGNFSAGSIRVYGIA